MAWTQAEKNTYERQRRAQNPAATRAIELKSRYKLSPDEKKKLFAFATGLCVICRKQAAEHIDHDHRCCPGIKACGKCIRGALCFGCNRGLGSFDDDPDLLRNAANYLESGGVSWR